MRFFVAAALLASVHGAAAAQTAFVEVDLRPAEITVGDHVEAELTLVWDGEAPAAPPRFPAWEETWGRAEVVDAGEVREVSSSAGRRIYSQTLTLTAFETGTVELPSRIVSVPLAAGTVEIPTRGGVRFRVDSVLPPESEAAEIDPRPAAALRALPGDRRFLWTSAALAGLALLAAATMAHRLRRPAAPPPPPAPRLLPPLDELLETLDRVDRGAGEPAHTAMSLALRRFLGRSLDFNALESTTSEIRRALGRGPLPEDLELTAADVLGDCDEVKYARLEVGEEVVAERLDLCRDLAHEIDRFLAPPEPAAPEEG